MAGVVILLGFFVRALLTGEDIPANFQIILGGILGLGLGQKFAKKAKDAAKPQPKKEDEDA